MPGKILFTFSYMSECVQESRVVSYHYVLCTAPMCLDVRRTVREMSFLFGGGQ